MAAFRLSGFVLPIVLASVSMGQEVPAQPAPAVANEHSAILDGIIKDLGSDDVLLRIDAERRLVDATSIRLRDIESAVKRHTLSPEQSKRLMAAAYARFCAEPRAGMGVQSEQFVGERGVVLQTLVPGFPAAEVLRAGDRLLSVDGRPINDISMMRPVVIARDPGDEVPVVVVRAGTTLNMKVRLGRFGDLNQRDRFLITTDVLEQAWLFRSAAISGAAIKQADVIESGLSLDAQRVDPAEAYGIGLSDGGDPNLDPMVRPDARRLQMQDSPETGVSAAGEPRGDGSQIRWAMDSMVSPMNRLAPADGKDAAGDLVRQRDVVVAALRDQQSRLRLLIGDLRSQLGPANEDQRRRLNEQMARLQRRIEAIDREVQAIQVVEP